MEYKNLGLLPVQGGLQLIKKQYGNDKRLSEFVKVINEYYVNKDERVLVKKGSGNIEWRKEVLNYLGLSIDDKKEVEDVEKIYNCCFRLYGIKRDIVDKFLDVETEDDEKNAIDLFWKYRNRRWNEICEKDKSSQS